MIGEHLDRQSWGGARVRLPGIFSYADFQQKILWRTSEKTLELWIMHKINSLRIFFEGAHRIFLLKISILRGRGIRKNVIFLEVGRPTYQV